VINMHKTCVLALYLVFTLPVNLHAAKPNIVFIAARLSDLGYTTGHVGKWRLKVNRKTKGWLSESGYDSISDVPDAVVNAYGPQGFGYDWFAGGDPESDPLHATLPGRFPFQSL